MRAYVLAAAALGLLAYAAHAFYSAGKEAGSNACEARHAKAAEAAAAEIERRDTASAAASGSMLDYLAAQMPKIEETKNATVERVRTIYRDRPVPVGCVRPDGVQAELDAARERANAAARRL